VRWELSKGEDRNELKVRWEESGGPAVSKPMQRGFGTRLIERTVKQQLRGDISVEFPPTGPAAIPLQARPRSRPYPFDTEAASRASP
jgi:hypothetical protein